MHYHEAAIEQKNIESSVRRYRKLYFDAVKRCAHITSVMYRQNEKEFYISLEIQKNIMDGEKVDNFRKWYYKVLTQIDNLLN